VHLGKMEELVLDVWMEQTFAGGLRQQQVHRIEMAQNVMDGTIDA